MLYETSTLLLVAIVFCLIGYARNHVNVKGGSGTGESCELDQVNVPVGQTPIQRAPTQFDDVIFSSAQSGLQQEHFSYPKTQA